MQSQPGAVKVTAIVLVEPAGPPEATGQSANVVVIVNVFTMLPPAGMAGVY